jgi:YesN/AraC family two-component response regulator
MKYWVCRNRYAKILEHKRKAWQAKEVERINTVVRQKNIKKVWEEIRNIVKKREFVNKVKPDEWVKHSGELFSSDTNRRVGYETQKLGPLYIEEMDRGFTKDEVKQRISKMKDSKATGIDGAPAEMWNIFCCTEGG